MNFGQTVFLVMLLKICTRICISDSGCGKLDLEATSTENSIVSSDYSPRTGPFTCTWIIQSLNDSHVIKFRMEQIFTKATFLCGPDHVIVRDGKTSYGRPLRVWCKNSYINDTITSYSSAIYVQLVTSSNDLGDLMFIMSYWATSQGQIIERPIEYGVANFILIVLSVFVGIALIGGAVYLYVREVKRQRERKKITFKQKLGVRRQGISGASGIINETFKTEESSSPEETSFTFLSPTPTSQISV